MSDHDRLTKKIRDLHATGRLRINRKHIFTERAYREIQQADLDRVIGNGKVSSVSQDNGIEWRGVSMKRRLKLIIRAQASDGTQTIEAPKMVGAEIRTAYDFPRVDDGKLRKNFLAVANGKWELDPESEKGYVRRVVVKQETKT